MFLWVNIIILGIIGGVTAFAVNKNFELISLICKGLTIVQTFGVIILIVIAVKNNIGADAVMASKKQRYNSLVTQYENSYYENDNDLGKKQLMDDITAWNEEVAVGKEMQNDFWLGIFYPNYYDDLSFIELK